MTDANQAYKAGDTVWAEGDGWKLFLPRNDDSDGLCFSREFRGGQVYTIRVLASVASTIRRLCNTGTATMHDMTRLLAPFEIEGKET